MCDVIPMTSGNRAADGGNLIFDSYETKENFIKAEPKAEKYIRPLVGGTEYINNKKRVRLKIIVS